MEPKGENIKPRDLWKQEFLQQLEARAEAVDEFGLSQSGIKILGLKFYQPIREGEFEEKLLNVVQK